MKIPVFEISVPEYQVDSEPNHEIIGTKIDEIIKKNFASQEIVIRCLGASDHLNKSIDELVDIIIESGTDRYDPEREGEKYDNVEGRHIDFFALPFLVKPDTKIMEQFIHPFYFYSKEHVRIDIVIIYDSKKVEEVVHTYDDDRIKSDGYIFKDKDKRNALKGIIKIL